MKYLGRIYCEQQIVKISDEELEFITGKTNIEEALPSLLQENTKCVVYTQWGKMVLQCI